MIKTCVLTRHDECEATILRIGRASDAACDTSGSLDRWKGSVR